MHFLNIFLLRTYKTHDEYKHRNGCLGISILETGIVFLSGHNIWIESHQEARYNSRHSPGKHKLNRKRNTMINYLRLLLIKHVPCRATFLAQNTDYDTAGREAKWPTVLSTNGCYKYQYWIGRTGNTRAIDGRAPFWTRVWRLCSTWATRECKNSF